MACTSEKKLLEKIGDLSQKLKIYEKREKFD